MREFRYATARRVLGALLLATAPLGAASSQGERPPEPRVQPAGAVLRFDLPALRVGVAEYDDGPTGTTVFYFPRGVKGAVDVRGGAPGTVNATTLMNGYERPMVRAVVFSGGSWWGLSAATGVANGIKDLETQQGNVDVVPDVVGAIIYDVGRRRFSRVTPDDALGRAALQAATTGVFPLGARGAGRFAMQGGYYARGSGADPFAAWPHSGQGGAFRTIGPTRIAVFTVVNALGAVVGRDGRLVRCARNTARGDCPTVADRLRTFAPIARSEGDSRDGPTGNTTLTLVVTNQKLPFAALQRLAVQVHGAMNRAIQPFATEEDGDVLYAVTTDEVENPSLTNADLGVAASELAWDAVLASVPEVPPLPSPAARAPAAEALRRFVGAYAFHGGGVLRVALETGALVARMEGNGRMYFDAGRSYRLVPATNGDFLVDAPARDVVRFVETGGAITGLTVNPGSWAVTARAQR